MPLDEVAYATVSDPTGYLIGSYRGIDWKLPGIQMEPYGVLFGALRGVGRMLSGI